MLPALLIGCSAPATPPPDDTSIADSGIADSGIADTGQVSTGYGGQDCFVLEDLDMVVVFTGNILYPVEMAGHVRDLMNGFIVPSHPDAG